MIGHWTPHLLLATDPCNAPLPIHDCDNPVPPSSPQLGLGPAVTTQGMQPLPGKVMLSETESPLGSPRASATGLTRHSSMTQKAAVLAVSREERKKEREKTLLWLLASLCLLRVCCSRRCCATSLCLLCVC